MIALFRVLSYLLRLSRDIRFSRGLILASAVAGLAGGFASSGMMALITTMITRSQQHPSVALTWAFAGACIALPSFRYFSQVLLTKLTQDSLIVLRMRLTRNILAAPLRQLETIGVPRLYASLTADVGQIVGSLAMIPTLLMHLALITGSLTYMAYLSWQLLLETLLFIAFGIFTYRFTLSRAVGYFVRTRELQNEMMARAREVVEGTKELKMHTERRGSFLEKIEGTITALQRQTRAGTLAFAATSSFGQVLFFVLVGLLVIVMPRIQPVSAKVMIGYTIVLFQMMSPLEVLLSSMPTLSHASVSMQALERLGFSLEAESKQAPTAEVQSAPWTLELAGITHSYRLENEEESFQLGPIDLTFHPGELVFIVGGNGSGKTTLAKLMLGLYVPEAGEIRFAGQLLTDDNREQYRQNFAAVFSDYFIFKTLYGLGASSLNSNARRYLEKLHLERKVHVEDGELSTVDLSQGQRKRLALLTAYLEDRPIYLFDEWAADQDPIFKRIFYQELLPELKARRKTVFVISHDDHYFHVADRIVKLNYGQVEFDQAVAEFSPASRPVGVLAEGAPASAAL